MKIKWNQNEKESLLELVALGMYIIMQGHGRTRSTVKYEEIKNKLVREIFFKKKKLKLPGEQSGFVTECALIRMKDYLEVYEESMWQRKLAENLAKAEYPGKEKSTRIDRLCAESLYERVLEERGMEAVKIEIPREMEKWGKIPTFLYLRVVRNLLQKMLRNVDSAEFSRKSGISEKRLAKIRDGKMDFVGVKIINKVCCALNMSLGDFLGSEDFQKEAEGLLCGLKKS